MNPHMNSMCSVCAHFFFLSSTLTVHVFVPPVAVIYSLLIFNLSSIVVCECEYINMACVRHINNRLLGCFIFQPYFCVSLSFLLSI